MESSVPAPARTADAVCIEKERLTRSYSDAAADLHRTVQVLNRDIGRMAQTEYNKIKDFCHLAEARVEQFRQELESHIAEHGC